MADHLLIFARHPALGLVKTRLAHTVGEEEALRVYEELLHHTRTAADGVAATKTLWLAGEPPMGPTFFADWRGYGQRPQPTGELGERMHHAFEAAFAEGASRVVIIGTDCPELSSADLEQAFAHLASHDVVVGPALDGGYYLLGMTTLVADFFRGKAWSTDSVLTDTLADANRLGLRLGQLPPLSDVDTASDLLAWQSRRA
ncbi:TIGR04282 family arsenosugar biosynthesis glycosyltransferase [Hymenobacter cellulosilyticus]|uniref:TIGR04282 family arsenosugar biosynthesis glycosyltransferase n=1 Tax=Hymenobacter cellulosilyticus TaxID=2932248 RepID=A0A8T9PX64_9BACT|nr:TIGR04282 family arsenosugar biosynthesis glycosyltransferase [Hymenobacter cellulosilyticus]UOQ69966.1 TIGR04282 family arsenosugar biosynthesis glycosyltransferase [Hymenobacter cellulosilyticus]